MIRHTFALAAGLASLAFAPGTSFAQEAGASALPPPSLWPLWQFALAWLAASVLIALLVAILWRWILIPVASRTAAQLDTAMLDATRLPAQWTAFFATLYAGSRLGMARVPGTALESAAWRLAQGASFTLLVISLTFAVFTATRTLLEWYNRNIASKTASTLDDQFITLFQKLSKFLFIFIAITIVFGHFGIQITGLLATAGVASLAIAFAAQETLANMIAGFVLIIDRTFTVGDRVELADGKMGDVIEIGLRSTKIVSFDHTVISIPNAEIAKNEIINFNAPTPQFKIRAKIGVAYGTDLRKVKSILMDVLGSHPEILKDPPPCTFFTEFGDSSLDLMYMGWIADYREHFRIRDELQMAIKDRFEENDIQIPFPQRDLHLRSVSPGISLSLPPAETPPPA